jgi:hypothetical protein
MGITLSPVDLKTGLFVTYRSPHMGRRHHHFINLEQFGARHGESCATYKDIDSIFTDGEESIQVDKETLMFYYFKLRFYSFFSRYLVIYSDIAETEEDFSEIQTATFFDVEVVMEKLNRLFSRLESIKARGDFSEEDCLHLEELKDMASRVLLE